MAHVNLALISVLVAMTGTASAPNVKSPSLKKAGNVFAKTDSKNVMENVRL